MTDIDKMYTDLEPNMSIAWNNDVARTTGNRSVKNSIISLITTRKGTRPFNSEYGCDIADEMFENMTPLSSNMIKQSIVDAIKNFEPRVERLYVKVQPVYDDNTLNVVIAFSIVDSPEKLEQIKLNLSN